MRIKLHWPRRKSPSSSVPNFTISFDDLTMTVDLSRLPRNLARQLPSGALAKAAPADWYPFCTTAIAMGLMR
jgi:hypothetical protein